MNLVELRELDGNKVLGIASGLTPRSFAQTRIASFLSSHGHVFRPDGTVDEWIPTGTMSVETSGKSEMYIYGPAFEGISLLSAVDEQRESAWKLLHTTISVLTKAYLEQKISAELMTEITSAGPGAVITAADGSVLVLPSDLFVRCVGGHGETCEITNRLLWSHPDHRTINPSWAFSFMAGTLAYRIASGYPPFGRAATQANTVPKAEDIASDMKNDLFEPLEVAVWAIRPAAASCINALVSTKVATSTDTLVSFGPYIDSIIDPAKESIPESEEFVAARLAVEKKILDTAQRKDFFRRHKTTLLIAGIAFILLTAFIASYIHDNGKKPNTLGLQPTEVVSRFYEGVNALDQDIPRSFMYDRVKSGYDDLMTNLFVTSKVRQSYEKDSGVVSPAKLYADKDPLNRMIYGITNLSIQENSLSKETGIYTVSFYFWLPESIKEFDTVNVQNIPIQLSIYAYKDIMTIGYFKDRWKITAIKQVQRDLVEGDAEMILKKITDGTAVTLPYAPSSEEIESVKLIKPEPLY